MGEGLSNLLGTLLHPYGYYPTNQGPRINQSLNGSAGPPIIAAARRLGRLHREHRPEHLFIWLFHPLY